MSQGVVTNHSSIKRVVNENKTEITMLFIFLLFFIVMHFSSEYFFTSKNLLNVMTQISTNAIIAIGMTLVIITGGIDLSVGSILGLSAMAAGMILQSSESIMLAIVVALGIGAFCGFVNGYLIGYMEMPPFIVTLGIMQVCSSVNYVISDGNTASKFPELFAYIGKFKLFGFPAYIIGIALLFLIFMFVMNKTKFGRFVYATGSNPEAARLSGINIKSITMNTYVLCGVLCAVAGLLLTSRMMAVDPTYGKGAEMDAIAAAVIGGTSMSGGKGTLLGTIIGVFLVGFLRNALNLLGVNPFWQGSAIGAVIIVAVLAEKISNNRSN